MTKIRNNKDNNVPCVDKADEQYAHTLKVAVAKITEAINAARESGQSKILIDHEGATLYPEEAYKHFEHPDLGYYVRLKHVGQYHTPEGSNEQTVVYRWVYVVSWDPADNEARTEKMKTDKEQEEQDQRDLEKMWTGDLSRSLDALAYQVTLRRSRFVMDTYVREFNVLTAVITLAAAYYNFVNYPDKAFDQALTYLALGPLAYSLLVWSGVYVALFTVLFITYGYKDAERLRQKFVTSQQELARQSSRNATQSESADCRCSPPPESDGVRKSE